MREMRVMNQIRGAEKIDSPVSSYQVPHAVPCGKSVEQMRSDTESFLSMIFKREVKIIVHTKP